MPVDMIVEAFVVVSLRWRRSIHHEATWLDSFSIRGSAECWTGVYVCLRIHGRPSRLRGRATDTRSGGQGLYQFFIEYGTDPLGSACRLASCATKGIRVHLNRLIGIAAAAALALSACSNSPQSEQDMSSMTTSAVATPSSSASPSERAPGTQAHNDADVTFAQGMIPHHQQAIEMSDMLLAKQGIDPRVVSLANEIKAAQGPEIQQLHGWLSEWGVSPTTSPGAGMPGMPGHDMGNMGGGMMTEEDLTALRNAQGVEASRLFLTQMIEHHRGAVAMAQTEVDNGQFAPAIEMARTIIASQQKEIQTMEQILGSL